MISEVPGFDESNELHQQVMRVIETYSKGQLFYFALQLQIRSKLYDKLKINSDRADNIIKHWNVFNDYLDANEDFREEWDALCMAMKLKEF